MKKRLHALAAALALMVLGAVCAAALTASVSAAEKKSPYYIMVNRKMNTVTVYTQDAAGEYTVPYKAMICSTGRRGHATPLGSFTITDLKKDWCFMFDGTWGQYSTQFSGHYLFHSICYTEPDPATLIASEYNLLGEVASLGCVRLQTADAKWIYDHCPAGTRVTIYDGDEAGPLGKPARAVDKVPDDCGWDPTDPRPENPWTQTPVEAVTLSAEAAELPAGSALTLTAGCEPAEAAVWTMLWESDAPEVASVTGGRVVGLSAGTAHITVRCGGVSAVCTVTVTGALLPFDDLTPGAWYYDDMRYASENGILNGIGHGKMDPNGKVTWPAALQLVYNLAGRPQTEPQSARWYGAALAWAEQAGLLEDMTFRADAPIGREEMAVLLWRFAKKNGRKNTGAAAALDGFADAGAVSGYARDAVSWAAGAGILQGDARHRLLPAAPMTRAQAAAILRRYQALA